MKPTISNKSVKGLASCSSSKHKAYTRIPILCWPRSPAVLQIQFAIPLILLSTISQHHCSSTLFPYSSRYSEYSAWASTVPLFPLQWTSVIPTRSLQDVEKVHVAPFNCINSQSPLPCRCSLSSTPHILRRPHFLVFLRMWSPNYTLPAGCADKRL